MATSHWFIGGGVAHSPEMVRRDTYAKLAGAEGIVEPSDLQVLPLAVLGGGVRVTIGSAYIKARHAGAVNELYMGSVTSQETVSVPPNGGSSVRHDLVVMRVKDPFWQGSPWPDPGAGLSEIGVGDAPSEAESARDAASYIVIDLITDVPAGTTRLQDVVGYENDTAYTLARIAMQPGSQVSGEMITPLREVARPRRSEVIYARPRVAADDGKQNYLTGRHDNSGEFFPGGGGFVNEFQVDIPSWANRMVIDASWMTIRMKGNPWGYMWIEFGDEYRNHTWPSKRQYEFTTQHFHYGAPNTTDDKTSNWLVMDEVAVPAKLRGKRVTFVFKASRADYAQIGSTAHTVYLDSSGGLGCRVTFTQAVFDDHMV